MESIEDRLKKLREDRIAREKARIEKVCNLSGIINYWLLLKSIWTCEREELVIPRDPNLESSPIVSPFCLCYSKTNHI